MVLLTDGSEAAVMLTDGSGLVVKGVGMVPSYSGKGRGSFAFPLPSCVGEWGMVVSMVGSP